MQLPIDPVTGETRVFVDRVISDRPALSPEEIERILAEDDPAFSEEDPDA